MSGYGVPCSSGSYPDENYFIEKFVKETGFNILIIDTGSSGCRVGFANENGPNVITNFTTDSPIHRGHIVDFGKLEDHWWEILNRPEIKYEGNPILFTVSQVASRQEMEMIAQTAFESFNATHLQIFNQSLLALYASAKTTGLVLDCGHELTHSVPIDDGKVYYPGAVTLELGGAELTKRLEKLIGPHEHIEEIKQIACEVHPNRQYVRQGNHVDRVLSTGEMIRIGNERFDCPEALFTPSLLKYEPGPLAIHEAIYHSLRRCNLDIRRNLCANILFTGGSTMFPGFDARLKSELTAVTPSQVQLKLDPALSDGRYASWVGGSTVASSISLADFWSSEDYNNCGPNIVHYKCSGAIQAGQVVFGARRNIQRAWRQK
ncbi:hypothetical protein Aperf_G00000108016 [Anoplocephala perfoliata]